MNLEIASRGKRIELFRTTIGLKQNSFAKKIGRSDRTISSWENDNGDGPTLKDIETMVKMGANPIFLTTGRGSILWRGFQQ